MRPDKQEGSFLLQWSEMNWLNMTLNIDVSPEQHILKGEEKKKKKRKWPFPFCFPIPKQQAMQAGERRKTYNSYLNNCV